VALLRGQLPTLIEADADRVAEALGDLPLAVAQAAGVIAETGMPAAEYLQLLHQSAAEVLAEGRPSSYPVPLAAAVRISHDRLAAEDAAAEQLLSLCAFLAPAPTPASWFTAVPAGVLPNPLSTVAGSRLAFRRTVGRIGRYGPAVVAEDRLQLHRLAQAVLRDTLPVDQRDSNADTVQAVLAAVNPGNPADPVAWPGWADLLPHLRAADLANTNHPDLRTRACSAAW
jgi:hypothetical protein